MQYMTIPNFIDAVQVRRDLSNHTLIPVTATVKDNSGDTTDWNLLNWFLDHVITHCRKDTWIFHHPNGDMPSNVYDGAYLVKYADGHVDIVSPDDFQSKYTPAI